MCEKAFRKEKSGKIYCMESGIVCAHQFWCDISVEFKHFPEAENCPGRRGNHEEDNETGEERTD